MKGVFPEPHEIVMLVVPTEQLRDAPVLLDIEDMSSLVRTVRWGELVSMVLNDSNITDVAKWAQVMGITVPTSDEVSSAELDESTRRLDRIEHLRPVIAPMVQILTIPTMVAMMRAIVRSDVDLSGDVVDPHALIEIGSSVAEALQQSVMSIMSCLADLELMIVNELQVPESGNKEEDE